MEFGTWPVPEMRLAGTLLVNGATGAVVSQTGAIIGTVTHPGNGQIQITLNTIGTPTDSNTAALIMANDGSARIVQWAITTGDLFLESYDAAGIAANSGFLFALIFTSLPVG